jgi:hypothetical protein
MRHLVALSFDHRVGNQIDVVFPPFPDEPYVTEWQHGLPFIAIPDKAHEACSSLIQFTLPHPGERKHLVYGLAAYRAIASEELSGGSQYLRNFVQKSLCVISCIPLFGELERELKESLYEHFDDLVGRIEDLFRCFSDLCQRQTVPFSGISYPSLFQSLQHNVLALVKAILHNRSILIFAQNSELVSKMVCAIASLLPGFIYQTPYPFRFLNSGGYSFSPYVPLQFSETLNSGRRGSKLMGTCSELFMDQRVVDYDILVDCRRLPALVQGDVMAEYRLTPGEAAFMRDLLTYLKENWSTPEAPDRIRGEFLRYINAVFASILRVRHIKLVPAFAWKYLDWEDTAVFGEKFVKKLRKNPAVIALVYECEEAALAPVDERFFVKKLKGRVVEAAPVDAPAAEPENA